MTSSKFINYLLQWMFELYMKVYGLMLQKMRFSQSNPQELLIETIRPVNIEEKKRI